MNKMKALFSQIGQVLNSISPRPDDDTIQNNITYQLVEILSQEITNETDGKTAIIANDNSNNASSASLSK